MPEDEDDVVFVFSTLRSVRVRREDAELLERDWHWLRTEDSPEAGKWLGIAIRGALDKGRDVLLDPHTRDDLCKILKQGRLDTPGLHELYAACRAPFT